MKNASRTTLVALILVAALDSRAASPDAGASSVAAAKTALETASANLAAAVKTIAVEPPADADLDTAHAAVGAVDPPRFVVFPQSGRAPFAWMAHRACQPSLVLRAG